MRRILIACLALVASVASAEMIIMPRPFHRSASAASAPNNALWFSGAAGQKMTCGDNASLKGMGAMTIMGWFFKTTADAKIVSAWEVSHLHYLIRNSGANAVQFYTYTTGVAGGTYNGSIFTNGGWNFFAARYNGSAMDVCINGFWCTETNAQSGSINSGGGMTWIAGADSGGDPVTTGGLDELWVFSRALSNSEISNAYTSKTYGTVGSAPCNSGLAAGWHFDATGTNSPPDFSGNGNTGTLINGPYYTNGIVVCP